MPTKLICQSCLGEFDSDGSGRPFVNCQICWAKVPAGAETKTPLPVAKRAKKVVDSEMFESKKPRVRTQPKPEGRASSKITAIVLVGLGILLIAGLAGIVIFGKPKDGKTTATETAKSTAPTVDSTPAKEQLAKWSVHTGPDGAKLLAPGPLNPKDSTWESIEEATGTRVILRIATSAASVSTSPGDAIAELWGVSASALVRGDPQVIPGGTVSPFSVDFEGESRAALVLVANSRRYIFEIRWKPETDPKELKRRAFFTKVEVERLKAVEPVRPSEPKEKPAVVAKVPRPEPAPKPAPIVKPTEPVREVVWAKIENQYGFAAFAPKGAKAEKIHYTLEKTPLAGRKWTAEDELANYLIAYVDLPDGFEPDGKKLVERIAPFGTRLESTSDGKFEGQAATRLAFEKKGNGALVARGFRLFCVLALPKWGLKASDEGEFADRTERFFKSTKFTFDAKFDDAYPGEAKWVEMADAKDFTAKVPKNATLVQNTKLGGAIPGVQYRTETGGIVYEVHVHDATPKRSTADVLKALIGFDKVVSGPDKIELNDRAFTAYEFGSSERPVLLRSRTIGKTVYALRTKLEPRDDDQPGLREFRDKSEQFFKGFHTEE